MSLVHAIIVCVIILLLHFIESPLKYGKRSVPNCEELEATTPNKKPPAVHQKASNTLSIPTVFSQQVENALCLNKLDGLLKLRMLREGAFFFHGFCPSPKPYEYLVMAKSL